MWQCSIGERCFSFNWPEEAKSACNICPHGERAQKQKDENVAKKKEDTAIKEKTHMELSPSHAERWWNCPGSVALCRTVPKAPQSENAAEGTAAHEVLERCLRQYHVDQTFLNPFDMIGMEIKEYEVNDEMAEAVALVIDTVKAELHKGGELLVETKVDVVAGVVGGTLDIAIIRPFEDIVVIDFKYGRGVVVSAVDNKQMILYLLGLAQTYGCPKAKTMIIQPRVQTGEPISVWDVPEGYLEVFKGELIRHIEMTKDTAAMCIPGSWCRWCDAKAVCPALRKDLGTAMAPVQNHTLVFPDAKTLTMENIVKVLDYKERIEKWMDAVCAHAYELAFNGSEVPGYELAKKRANRQWKDEKEVLAKFADMGEAILKVKVVSPAQLEKMVPKERKEEIEALTEKPDNGLTLKKVGKK
jgi:hypothetical protein